MDTRKRIAAGLIGAFISWSGGAAHRASQNKALRSAADANARAKSRKMAEERKNKLCLQTDLWNDLKPSNNRDALTRFYDLCEFEELKTPARGRREELDWSRIQNQKFQLIAMRSFSLFVNPDKAFDRLIDILIDFRSDYPETPREKETHKIFNEVVSNEGGICQPLKRKMNNI